MAYDSVDLPEPLGPMIACTSPERTVRLTPLRISFVPSSEVTDACRSLISRVAMVFPQLLVVWRGGRVTRLCARSEADGLQLVRDSRFQPLENLGTVASRHKRE